MSSVTGIAAIGTYGNATIAEDLAELLTIIPNPDSTATSGAQAGGGNLDEMSAGAAAQLRVEIATIMADSPAEGGSFTTYTMVAADDTANQADIPTGLDNLTIANSSISIIRGGTLHLSDPVITEPTPGTIRVADGATYKVTAGDVVNIFAQP